MLDEALSIITHLGLETMSITHNNKDFFYETSYDLENGLSINVSLYVRDGIVKNLTININPEKKKSGFPRSWLAYSPETLIQRYGRPSKVDVFVDRGPQPIYTLVFYFDALNLIIEYISYDIDPNFGICPLRDQVTFVRAWMGKNPVNPPSIDVPLEEATSMTMEEFSKLMTGNPGKACFNLKDEMFP